MTAPADALRGFIVQNFLYGDATVSLAENDSFSERGIVDSTGILELVAFVEESFKISVADEEILPDNFDSLAKLVEFVRRKQVGISNAG